jgi:hypothetical protein
MPEIEKGLAHKMFLKACGGDPRNVNLSALARFIGISPARLWFYANERSEWKADIWLQAMVKLGKVDRKAGTLTIQDIKYVDGQSNPVYEQAQ